MSASQNAAVLALLREKGMTGLTPLEALERVGTLRLGARIWDLRKAGHLIVNRGLTFGTGDRRKHVACYVLIDYEEPPPPDPPIVVPGQSELWKELNP